MHTIYVRTKGRLSDLKTELQTMLKDVECKFPSYNVMAYCLHFCNQCLIRFAFIFFFSFECVNVQQITIIDYCTGD